VTLLPYLTGMSGLIYLVSAVLLGFGFIYYAVLMMRKKDNKTAMKTFVYSIVYITLLFCGFVNRSLSKIYFMISLITNKHPVLNTRSQNTFVFLAKAKKAQDPSRKMKPIMP